MVMIPKGGVITETKLDCHGSRELDLKFTLQHKLIIQTMKPSGLPSFSNSFV